MKSISPSGYKKQYRIVSSSGPFIWVNDVPKNIENDSCQAGSARIINIQSFLMMFLWNSGSTVVVKINTIISILNVMENKGISPKLRATE